ncbi:hypothetical protein ColKHC_10122 [Colletotrichum higginsianum]|nr:hypothetical protein ColKHC_10122 [Colletotrichum higginsianum]
MAASATLDRMPVIPEEKEDEEWEDASSSSDDNHIEGSQDGKSDDNDGDDEHILPPPELLLSHETARAPSPPAHAPRHRLLYRSQGWDTQIYMLKNGKVLKERASYPKLSQGYFGADAMSHVLRHWSRVLPEQLQEILGPDHPYLARVAVAMAPRQRMLIRGSDDSDHLPDQLIESIPKMQGRLVMDRVRPVKPTVVRVLIEEIVGPEHRRRAYTTPENFSLHPKAWLGFEQPPAVRDMLRNYPNLTVRPAYLDQLVKFIGRRGVLELAREMGTALAVIHYDLNKDAHYVKFRLGYNHVLDRVHLWLCGLGSMGDLKVNDAGDGFENERFYPRPGVGPGVFDAFWAAYLLASEGILRWRGELAPEGLRKDRAMRTLMIKVLLERLSRL